MAAEAVREGLHGVTRAEFLRDGSLRDIVARRLTIVGEAVARLTQETRLRAPDVDWAEVVAFRNVVVHDYFAINWKIVWRVALRDLPALRARIEVLHRELDTGPR